MPLMPYSSISDDGVKSDRRAFDLEQELPPPAEHQQIQFTSSTSPRPFLTRSAVFDLASSIQCLKPS